jgi:hypothetical protein
MPTDMSLRLGGLALLVLLTGCATTTSPDEYAVSSGQVSTPNLQPANSPSASGPPIQSHPRLRPPLILERPPAPLAPVEPVPGLRVPTGAAARLLNIPAAIAAILLWPSDLGGDTVPRDWKNTIHPVSLLPWRSQQEYDQFWRLPQPERERLIQERRNTMAGSNGSAPEPKPEAPTRMASRRHPNQTCDDTMLDHLQAEKNRICGSIPGESCGSSKTSPKRLARMPCSAIRLRIQALRNCMNIRQFIQEECFGGLPDTRHQRAFEDYEKGLTHCLELEAVNCAPGHPMAEL